MMLWFGFHPFWFVYHVIVPLTIIMVGFGGTHDYVSALSFVTFRSSTTPLSSFLSLSLRNHPPFVLHQSNNPNNEEEEEGRMKELSRRDAVLLGIGTFGYGKVVSTAYQKLSRQMNNEYPQMHEQHVYQTFTQALQLLTTTRRPLRILEIGIGKECRTIRRGMYSSLLTHTTTNHDDDSMVIEFIGMDLPHNVPTDETIIQEINDILFPSTTKSTFQVVEGDITNTNRVLWDDGTFDLITCSLLLCSVSSVQLALQEIQRLLHPTHGVFAYVEHIAASNSSFLELQQIVFDPLQQLLAHNCHLHRPTNQLIQQHFTNNTTHTTKIISQETFLIPEMWPVSYQCSGILQLQPNNN